MTITIRSVLALSIAMGVSQREAQKATFIISLISHTLFDHKFDPYRQQWILSSTLATILCYHYDVPNWIHFDGKEGMVKEIWVVCVPRTGSHSSRETNT